MKTTFETLPVIDLSALDTERGVQTVVEKFSAAYTQLGFGAIINHGIDPGITRAVFNASRRFHALPLAEKMKVALNENHRGYIPVNTSIDVNSTLAEVTKPNQSESFMMMREDADSSNPVLSNAYLAGANQWPVLTGFEVALNDYHHAIANLGWRLVEVACMSIGVPAQHLLPAFDCPTTWLRLLHYPPQQADAPDDLFGSAPHTDFGAITIVAQDNVAGLQVQAPDGQWLDVPVIENAFIVNVGDMLHRWSNGILKSTPHRVINRTGAERYSCAFFYDPYVDTVIAPLSECITVDRPVYFEPVNYGEFLRAELEAAYQQHQ